MNFESRTLIFDIICAILFIIMGIFYFNAITVALLVKAIVFIVCIIGIGYFGIYRNHNYTEEAFIRQGELDIDKGRTVSNLDVSEQIIPDDVKGVEE